jgi:hypothetical protein
VLLLAPDLLDERRRLTREGELGALYDSLTGELEPLLRADLYVPEAKALLSRAGGRCEMDGAILAFDPWSPQAHRCPQCGTTYTGELHHRAWVMHYQLWLAERAVHSALFYALRGEPKHRALAQRILDAYADRYPSYPNVDNVLGPGRVFFSTYLESIWLLQICTATDLLRAAGDSSSFARVAERIIEPSRAIIEVFDEGMSNRQVWNNAALMAADTVLGDDRAFDARLHRRSASLAAHLANALLPDGTWYEGENYHQFGLRGLWFGVTIAESRGATIDARLLDRFDRAFEALYLTALPDFTMPSRKDSQYAVSLRQWRIAEMAELGFARTRSPRLASALARTYEPGHPRVDTGRSVSTADAERNGPGGALTRADLGWRGLLCAVPRLPAATPRQPQSVILEGQGLAVFRRAPDVYVSLDYGTYGGGHGHPDRLNVNLSVGEARLLDDLGTGSYVDPTLHWYRSTLAHNAPLVNGWSQPESDGILAAHDERGALGWSVAAVDWPARGVKFERALVVAPEYFVDELRWVADADARVELPWHLAGDCELAFESAVLDGKDGLEDGFAFVERTERAAVRANAAVEIRGARGAAWFASESDADLFRGTAPGQPATRHKPFYLLRSHGRSGRFRAVVAWSELANVSFTDAGVDVTTGDGSRHQHRRDEHGWHVELFAMGARSSVDLSGFRQPVQPGAKAPRDARVVHLSNGEVSFELGEEHYRRSEATWQEAGSPTASVEVKKSGSSLGVAIHVRSKDQRFAAADAQNPYDNEHADTMGAGIQLYLRTSEGLGGWMFIPESGTVRRRAIAGWRELALDPTARWTATDTGYSVFVDIPIGRQDEFALDLVINEAPFGRERRRGQLVLSGANGEFVYLRGDRHDDRRLLNFRVAP